MAIGGEHLTTTADIRQWLNEAEPEHTHMLVVCDTFSYEDYPVYIHKDEDVYAEVSKRHCRNMQRVMEVYDLRKDLERQLNEHRAGQDYIP